MLRRDSVHNIQSGRLSRKDAYLVVTMLFYPRFLKKDLINEYVHALAPPADLFTEFKKLDRQIKNHNTAFNGVNYEARFDLSAEGRAELARLSEMSHHRDVVLICVCRETDRCHCDLLLMWARHVYGAKIKGLTIQYPNFESRLAGLSESERERPS
jgi:uncharacterized protein YeaO (DUF488 family)